MSAEEATRPVRGHPRIAKLGRSLDEQDRVDDLAHELARWLFGEPEEQLSAITRVVTRVARRELQDPRQICSGRALLAVEAAARATEALWPYLRDVLEPPPPPEAEAPQGDEGAPRADLEEADDGEEADGPGVQIPGGQEPGDGSGSGSDPDQEATSADGSGEGDGDGDGEGDGPGEGDEPGEGDAEGDAEPNLAPGAANAAASAALSGAFEADRVSRHLDRMLPGIGWSSAAGALDRALLDHLDDLTRLVGRLDELKRIAEALGRVEDASRREGFDEGGGEEVVGVHLGGEVAHALPAEMALLGDPSTEDLFYQRLIERRLLSLELTGSGMDGSAMADRRGPVIACIDTSGSMEGHPERLAKALVLAVCRQILPRGRSMHLLLFGGPGQREEIRLRRGRAGLEGLIGFLARRFGAGTDFDGPLLRAVELLDDRDWGRADILVVTDGLCRAGSHVIRAVDQARERHGVRVWSVVVGAAATHGVAPFSDEVWQVLGDRVEGAVGMVRRLN